MNLVHNGARQGSTLNVKAVFALTLDAKEAKSLAIIKTTFTKDFSPGLIDLFTEL